MNTNQTDQNHTLDIEHSTHNHEEKHHHQHDHEQELLHTHSHGPKETVRQRLINIGIGLIVLALTPIFIGFASDYSIAEIRERYSSQFNSSNTEINIGTVQDTNIQENTQLSTVTYDQQITITPEDGGPSVQSTITYFNEEQIPNLSQGERVFYQTQNIQSTGETIHGYLDVYRLDSLYWLLGVFMALVIILTGLKGISAFIGLIFTTMVIFNYMLPEILTGSSIIITTFLSAIVIIFISMFLSHGFRKPTFVAVFSALFTIIVTFVSAIIVERAMNFTGVSSHELSHLQSFQTTNDVNLDLRSLFLAGIVLGSLGVLDDVTIAQAYVVDELYKARKLFKPMEVFWAALRVGQEHIVSLINTLTLAYVATGLPFVIQFLVFGYGDIFISINSEVISGEIVRAILGSMSLFLAIPISTIFAAFFLNTEFISRITKRSEYEVI